VGDSKALFLCLLVSYAMWGTKELSASIPEESVVRSPVVMRLTTRNPNYGGGVCVSYIGYVVYRDQ